MLSELLFTLIVLSLVIREAENMPQSRSHLQETEHITLSACGLRLANFAVVKSEVFLSFALATGFAVSANPKNPLFFITHFSKTWTTCAEGSWTLFHSISLFPSRSILITRNPWWHGWPNRLQKEIGTLDKGKETSDGQWAVQVCLKKPSFSAFCLSLTSCDDLSLVSVPVIFLQTSRLRRTSSGWFCICVLYTPF